MPLPEIRPARPEDAEQIAAIYNLALDLPHTSWRAHPADLDEIRSWLPEAGGRHRMLVAMSEGRLLGYGGLGQFRPTPGFERTAEISVYVDESARNRGVGLALLNALMMPHPEIYTVIALIDAENTGSIRLHERAGFERRGLFPGLGTKWDTPRDLVILQQDL